MSSMLHSAEKVFLARLRAVDSLLHRVLMPCSTGINWFSRFRRWGLGSK